MQIDRDSRENPWEQVAAELRRRIAAGEFGPDDPLPSLVRLQQETGLNGKTIRKAYKKLMEQGLVEAVNGRGYYVRRP